MPRTPEQHYAYMKQWRQDFPEKHAAQRKRHAERKKLAGVCRSCTKPAEKNRTRCRECLKKDAARQNRHQARKREERRTKGLCLKCGKTDTSNSKFRTCLKCRLANNASHHRRKNKP